MNRILVGLLLTIWVSPSAVHAQRSLKKDEDFLKDQPRIGDSLPDLTIYNVDGREIRTGNFRGHYTVLTFGCLT